MTEISRYWEGLITGDATAAPYTAAVFQELWGKLFASADNQGVLDGFLDELEVTGAGLGVSVAAGGGLVAGVFYESTEIENIAISSPSSDPRIDRIVARKTPSSNEVRIVQIVGTEAASPSAPSITQVLGGIWDIPLAQVLITVAGAITITDERELVQTPLSHFGSIEKIEAIDSDDIAAGVFSFESIPQRFKHLKIDMFGRHTDPGPDEFIEIYARFNADEGANYNAQSLRGVTSSTIAAAVGSQTELLVGEVASDGIATGVPGHFSIFIYNYTLGRYKTITAAGGELSFLLQQPTSPDEFQVRFTGGLWENVDPITQIQLLADPGAGLDSLPFVSGTKAILYGIPG